MRYNIVVVGFLISVFNNVAVPEIVTQQPSPIQARLRTLVWLENGVTIKWCPYGDDTDHYGASRREQPREDRKASCTNKLRVTVKE